MNNNLTLKKPLVTLGGETINELIFNFEALTPLDYKQILSIESRLRGQNNITDMNVSRKTSSEFRIATAWVAAVKGTKGLCLDDFERLSMLDLLECEDFGAFFIYDVE